MTTFSVSELVKQLRGFNNSQSSITEMSKYALKFPEDCKMIAQIWHKEYKKGEIKIN